MQGQHSHQQQSHRARNFFCKVPNCPSQVFNRSGLTQHMNVRHQAPVLPPNVNIPRSPSPMVFDGAGEQRDLNPLHKDGPRPATGKHTEHHPILDGVQNIYSPPYFPSDMHLGTPCDHNGNNLPPNSPPPPPPERASDNFSPFASRTEFEIAEFLFTRNQMPGKQIDVLMDLWEVSLPPGHEPPFTDHKGLYSVIDSTTLGDIPWQSFSVSYNGDIPDSPPPWMTAKYNVWFCDPCEVMRSQLANPDFKSEINYAPKQVFNHSNKCQYKDFMSGIWAWNQAVSTINTVCLYSF
jgi:hypothetical protein